MAAIPITPLPPGYHNKPKGQTVDPELQRAFIANLMAQTRPEAEFERIKREDVGLVDPLAKTAANAAYLMGGPAIEAVANPSAGTLLDLAGAGFDPSQRRASGPMVGRGLAATGRKLSKGTKSKNVDLVSYYQSDYGDAQIILRGKKRVTPDEVRGAFFPEYSQRVASNQYLNPKTGWTVRVVPSRSGFMESVSPGRQPFKLDFFDENMIFRSPPENIRKRVTGEGQPATRGGAK
jgi:hypothetical protein